MNLSDPISDLLTRIRNAQANRQETVISPSSTVKINLLEVLKREGYIRAFKTVQNGPRLDVIVELKYTDPDNQPVIQMIERVSKPGRRVYSDVGNMPKVYNGLGISILSTSKGVMSDHEAREANVGGEILCRVF